MSNRSKSLFRGPGVKHFALVHRSVRDPALNEGASERVFAEVDRKQGRTKQDLEATLKKTGGLDAMRDNEGEAAAHGIYYDDTEYDYMQHLRIVGQSMDSHLVEAPKKNDTKGKGKALSLTLKEEEEHRAKVDQQGSYKTYLESTAPAEGLQPDMDPALREVLEALEDDAYIADDEENESPAASSGPAGGEDFFSNLIAGSGKGDFRDTPFDDDEEYDEEDEDGYHDDDGEEVQGLDADSAYAKEVLRYKKGKAAAGDSDDEFEEEDEAYEASEGGDTIAALRAASARRPPRQAGMSDRRSTASASAFSMSSSAMFRNDGLQTLDDRFDQIERMYDEDEESDDEDEPLELGTDRQAHFDKAMDDFLCKYEIVGGRMQPTIGDGTLTAAEKLEAVRGQMDKLDILGHVQRQDREEQRIRLARKKGDKTLDDELWDMVRDIDIKENKWDCETILSTYSNLENHPRMLKLQGALGRQARQKGGQASADAKIVIDPKTGFPVVINPVERMRSEAAGLDDDQASDSTMDAEEANSGMKRHTITREKGESAEQKKARKAQVKAEKQARRLEKKSTKEAFDSERKRQMKVRKNQLRDAADISKPGVRSVEVMSLS